MRLKVSSGVCKAVACTLDAECEFPPRAGPGLRSSPGWIDPLIVELEEARGFKERQRTLVMFCYYSIIDFLSTCLCVE